MITFGDLRFEDASKPIILLYAISGTLLVLIIVIVIMFVQNRRHRLNWYEQNLLEMAHSPPQYMRCRAVPRIDTEDDETGLPISLSDMERKQSRIRRVRRDVGDVSSKFHVPKAPKHLSMFSTLDQSDIDRGMYTTNASESSYDEDAGFCGSLKLALYMDTSLNLLTVSLKQATDLVAKRQDGYPNPYFKVSLDVPEQTKPKSEQHTRIARNTSSPVIEEDFFFQISADKVNQSRLEVMVFDYDQFSVDECIGYCWLTLGRVAISTLKEQPTIFWAEVLPFDDDGGTGFGEVLFSLTYLSKAQRLTVNIFKARNLKAEQSDASANYAMRVSILNNGEKRLKKKKTSAKKNTRNPQYNESLTFGIPKSCLCDTILEIEAINDFGTFGMGSKVLGRLELPLHQCKDLWRAIIREEKSQARWYPLEAAP